MKSTSCTSSAAEDGFQHHVAVAVAASKLGLDDQLRTAISAYSACLQATDNDGRTCLHYAAACGHDECVDILLEAGANPLAVDVKGDVPLHFASVNKHPMCAYVITKASPDSCLVKNRKVQTPVQAAVACTSYEVLNAMLLACSGDAGQVAVAVMRVLLAAGAVPDTWAPNGSSALMLAASADATEALQVLLDNGATVELQDSLGRSALMFAAGNNSTGALQRLLAAGACLAQRDRRGRSVLDYAPEESDVRTVLQERLDSLEEAASKLQDDLLASLEQEAASGKKKAPKKSSKKRKAKAAQLLAASLSDAAGAATEAAAAAAPLESAAVDAPSSAAEAVADAAGADSTAAEGGCSSTSGGAAAEAEEESEHAAAAADLQPLDRSTVDCVGCTEAAVLDDSCESKSDSSCVRNLADSLAVEEGGAVASREVEGLEAASLEGGDAPAAAAAQEEGEARLQAAASDAGQQAEQQRQPELEAQQQPQETEQLQQDGHALVQQQQQQQLQQQQEVEEKDEEQSSVAEGSVAQEEAGSVWDSDDSCDGALEDAAELLQCHGDQQQQQQQQEEDETLEGNITAPEEGWQVVGSKVGKKGSSQQQTPAWHPAPPSKTLLVKKLTPRQTAPSKAAPHAGPAPHQAPSGASPAPAAEPHPAAHQHPAQDPHGPSFKSALLGRAEQHSTASSSATPPTTPTPAPYTRDPSTDGSPPETPNSTSYPSYPTRYHHYPHQLHMAPDNWSGFDSPSFLSAVIASQSQSSLAPSSHDDAPSRPVSAAPGDDAASAAAAREVQLLAAKVASLEAKQRTLQGALRSRERRHAQELAMVLEDAAQHEAEVVSDAVIQERARIFSSLQMLGLSAEVLLLLAPDSFPTPTPAPTSPPSSTLHSLSLHNPFGDAPLAGPLPPLPTPISRACRTTRPSHPSFPSIPIPASSPLSAHFPPPHHPSSFNHSPQSMSPLGTPPLTSEILNMYSKMSATDGPLHSHCLSPRRAPSPSPSDWDLQACLPVDLFDAPVCCT